MKESLIVIIGGGPAGIFAYQYARQHHLKTVLLEANETLGGQPKYLYPEKTIDNFEQNKQYLGKEFVDQITKDIIDDNDVFLNCSVQKITKDKNGYIVETGSSQIFFAKYVIVAIGLGFFELNRLDCAPKKAKNIHYLVNDLTVFQNQEVVILGGGDSAIDYAILFADRSVCKKVTIIHRRQEFRSLHAEKLNLYPMIRILLDKTIQDCGNDHLIIEDNKTHIIEKIFFDQLLIQYGCTTKTCCSSNLLNQFKLNELRKIIVDQNYLTCHPNIYAIGDIIKWQNKENLLANIKKEAEKCLYHIAQTENNE